MLTTVIRDEDYEPAERFEAWCHMVSRMPCQHLIRTEHTDDFRFTLRMASLGIVSLAHTSLSSIRAIRTPRLIRQGDNGTYLLELCTRGRIGAEQSGREMVATAGQWILHDSSRPHSLWSFTEGLVRPSAAALSIPKALLGLDEAKVAPLLTRPLPGDTGIGGMITDVLGRVLDERGAYRPADAHRLGNVLRDLVAAMLAHEIEAEHLLPEDVHARALNLRVRAFALAHLGDPALSPGVIAAANHISVSYLHRLFRRDGRPVAAWIREQRLERARRDLADPAQRHTPVHVIAARWGFVHASDFSRAFRRAYGMAPRDYRHATQR